MYYSAISHSDIANGIGCRSCIWVSGCRNHCEECFQPQTWNFSFGQPFTDSTILQLLSDMAPSYIDGMTILGGEPFEPENQKELNRLITLSKRILPNKTIWIYTGFTLIPTDDNEFVLVDDNAKTKDLRLRAVTENLYEILSQTDILVDGRYDKTQRDTSLAFRGSKNQRLIDMKQTFEQNEIVITDY